jgi:hypothetical protein
MHTVENIWKLKGMKIGFEVLPRHLCEKAAVNNEKLVVIVHTPVEVRTGHLQNRSQKRRRLKQFGRFMYVCQMLSRFAIMRAGRWDGADGKRRQ